MKGIRGILRQSKRLIQQPPQALGIMWDDVSITSADYTTNGGATYSFDGSTLTLSNGSASFNDWVKPIGIESKYRYHNLESWKQTVEITTPSTFSSTSYGFGMGILAQGEALHNRTRIALDTNATYQNRLVLYDNSNFTRQQLSNGTFVFATNTKYWLEFFRDKDSYILNIYDSGVKDNLLASINSAPTNGYGDTSWLWHNTGEWSFHFFGGITTLHSWKIESDVKKYPKILWIGDSNTVGFKTGLSNRYIERYNIDNGLNSDDQTVMAGIGDRIAEISLTTGLIQELSPKVIFLVIGVNDRRNGRTETQVETDWTTLADTIRNENPMSKFICVSPPASNTHNMSFLDTHISNYASTNSLKFVSLYTATKDSTTSNIDSTYNVGDGLHYNSMGHQAMADALSSIIPL